MAPARLACRQAEFLRTPRIQFLEWRTRLTFASGITYRSPDITYIAIAAGFVYMAAILDAWSRRVVGYAISRSIDARLAVAALKAAIRARQPPKGCIHHSDRGSQYASEVYRGLLADHGIVGSMGRRGNPYGNAKTENSRRRSRSRPSI